MRRERRYKKVSVLKNKKTWFFLIILIFCIIALYFVLRGTGAIFESTTSSEADIDIAFYCVKEDFQTMTLKLESMVPRPEPYIYNFTVSNFDGAKRTETKLEYVLTIRTTTNIPLNFKLFDTNSGSIDITDEEIAPDEDGTIFRRLKTNVREFGFLENQTNNYRLEIELPIIYKDSEYQDLIELVEINVDSKQKIE